MPCFHPLKAIKSENGVQVLSLDAVFFNLQLPCGRCFGCRLERSRQWAMRCMHEASLHKQNSFITLTYSDEHLPYLGSLHYPDFQKFMKRLRKYGQFRFYMCGEYGETNPITKEKDGGLYRPHFHAIIYGTAFSDRKPLRRTPSGSLIYRSPSLESLWPFGHSSVGDVSFESAAYVARYVMKKINGDQQFGRYVVFDKDTGEILGHKVPEFNRMSLKPGIGAGWFDKFQSDVFPHDYVVINNSTCKPPRYYDKLLKRVDSDVYELIKDEREKNALLKSDDNTPRRLIDKETFLISRTRNLKRNL